MNAKELDTLWLALVLGPASRKATEGLALKPGEEGVRRRVAMLPHLTETQQKRAAEITDEKLAKLLNLCAEKEIGVLTAHSDAYPDMLRQLPDMPLALYVKGDISLLSAPLRIAIVGTRRPSAYGSEATKFLAGGLAKAGALVVSGLAAGLDSVAQKEALAQDCPTVGVVGCGLDIYYPAANRPLQQLMEKRGAVVSEYPPGTRPQKVHFLQRNRLIAGLCHALVVAEARRNSGTMYTVGYALEGGKEVFAVPGSIFSPLSEGTNALLAEGAVPATKPADVLAAFGIAPEPALQQTALADDGEEDTLSPEATLLYNTLNTQGKTAEALCAETGLSPATALAQLAVLCATGKAKKLPGLQYAKAL